jgi:triacylglycerol lipase
LICTRLEAPIVLAHGLFGFRRIGVGRFTIAAYFRGIPSFLHAGGNRVVVTRVPPIAGLDPRARALAREIDLAIPGQPFHLVGHSMGGLDARRLLADPAWANRCLSLTTIATPHLGSALADRARLRVGKVYKLLRAMRIDCRGFLDVTRHAARSAHADGPIAARVPCFCVAAVPEPGEVCWPLKPFHEIVQELEGPNDGLVSAESALGMGDPLPPWPIDHLRQMNWLPAAEGPSSSRSVFDLYGALVENLAAHGFAARGEPVPAGRHRGGNRFASCTRASPRG